MKRRCFLSSTMMSLAVPGLSAAQAANDASPVQFDYLFYDQRFHQAETFAAEVGRARKRLTVQSDITEIWQRELAAAAQRAPLSLAGVTTESFYFCLTVMLRANGQNTYSRRLTRDLHIWFLRSDYG